MNSIQNERKRGKAQKKRDTKDIRMTAEAYISSHAKHTNHGAMEKQKFSQELRTKAMRKPNSRSCTIHKESKAKNNNESRDSSHLA